MAIYRLHDSLHIGENEMLRKGTLTRLDFLSEAARDKLEERETISRVMTPPLIALPGWKLRAKTFESIGIIDIEQLIEASPDNLATMLQKDAALIQKWQAEAELWLMPEKKLDGCACQE